LLAETLSDVNQKKLRHVFIFCALVKEKLSDPEINQDMDRIEKEFKEQGVNNELVAEMYFELINPGFRS
jgi:L-fucose isomerase-like protein